MSLFDLDLDALNITANTLSKCTFHINLQCGLSQFRSTIGNQYDRMTVVDSNGVIVSESSVHEDPDAHSNDANQEEGASNNYAYTLNCQSNNCCIEWDDLMWRLYVSDEKQMLKMQLLIYQPLHAHESMMLGQQRKHSGKDAIMMKMLGRYNINVENWMNHPQNGAGITTILGKLKRTAPDATADDEVGLGAAAVGIDLTKEEMDEERERRRLEKLELDLKPEQVLCKIRIISVLRSGCGELPSKTRHEQLLEDREVDQEARILMIENGENRLVPAPSKVKQSFAVGAIASSFDPRMLIYPYDVSIQNIQVFDLPNAHLLTKNAPFVRVSCNDWTEVSPVS